MYSRVTTIEVVPGKMEDLIDFYEHSLVPAARREHGFRGSLLLRDPDAGRAMLMTFWETEGDMLASEQGAYYREKLARVRAVARSSPSTDHFEATGDEEDGDSLPPHRTT